MSAPTFPVLGPSTLNRDYTYQVKVDGTWTTIGGLMTAQFQPSTGNWVDNTDQAGRGAQSSNKTGYTWSVDIGVDRKRGMSNPTTYDVAQEALRLASLATGNDNTIELRIFEYDPNDPDGTSTPRVEAYHGFCGVDWVPDGGDMMADKTVKVSLKGQGALDAIDHPYPATPVVPVVDSITPATVAVAGGSLAQIYGAHFTGTTAVTLDGQAVTAFLVVSDSQLSVEAGAHAAGSGAVVVTNATGASTAANPTVTYA